MSRSTRGPDPTAKRDLFDAFQFIEAFREMRPEMPMHMASAFLLVAMRPGVSQRELLILSETAQATMSRNIAALTVRDRHGRPGMNLITQYRHPADARNSMLYLTPDGEAFLARLMAIIRPQRSTDQT